MNGPMKEKLTRDGFLVTEPVKVYVWRKEKGDEVPYIEIIRLVPDMIQPYLGGPEWAIIRPGRWATLLDTTFASELKAHEQMLAECGSNNSTPGFRKCVENRIQLLSKSKEKAA